MSKKNRYTISSEIHPWESGSKVVYFVTFYDENGEAWNQTPHPCDTREEAEQVIQDLKEAKESLENGI